MTSVHEKMELIEWIPIWGQHSMSPYAGDERMEFNRYHDIQCTRDGNLLTVPLIAGPTDGLMVWEKAEDGNWGDPANIPNVISPGVRCIAIVGENSCITALSGMGNFNMAKWDLGRDNIVKDPQGGFMRSPDVREYHGHTDTVIFIVPCRDDIHFLSASDDRTIRRWNIQQSRSVMTYRAGYVCDSLHVSADGLFFFTSSTDKGLMTKFDILTGQVIWVTEFKSNLWKMGIWQDSNVSSIQIIAVNSTKIFVGVDNGNIHSYDCNDGTYIDTLLGSHVGQVWDAVICKNENYLISIGGIARNTIIVWDTVTGTKIKEYGDIHKRLKGHDTLCISNCGTYCFSTGLGRKDGVIRKCELPPICYDDAEDE